MTGLRRFTPLLPALALVALSALPAAGARSARTEMVTYDSGSGIHVMDYVWFEFSGAPEAQPLAGERTVSIEITDESGRPVAGVVHQGDAELGEVCGRTETPLRLVSRKWVHVHIYGGPGCDGVSVPTTGTVTFTFAR